MVICFKNAMSAQVISLFQCTNNCELGFRTDAHLNATFVKETGFLCWYHPTDTAAQAVLEKPSTAWVKINSFTT